MSKNAKPLEGVRALVTSGPTHEPLDPVRFLGNRSSGRQGHAIAEALARAGAKVTLISGPVALADPKGVAVKHVITAREMLAESQAALPVDIAVCAAAVADWRPKFVAAKKIKKSGKKPELVLVENPDILQTLCRHKQRPPLVIGFAAETNDVQKNAKAKLAAKGCDWMVANHASALESTENVITLITPDGAKSWPRMSKKKIAEKLVANIVERLC